MKKLTSVLCFILISAVLFGCGTKEKVQDTGNMQLGNPWKSFDTLVEAEKSAGTALGLPETIADFTASDFRVMNGALLEVTYRSEGTEVTVRKQAGEGEDISGDYTQYPTISETDVEGGHVTIRTDGKSVSVIISHGGFSWSVYSLQSRLLGVPQLAFAREGQRKGGEV